MTEPGVSIIVPVRDEAESVVALHEEIASVMQDLGGEWELVFVDDGSNDATFDHLRRLHDEQRGVRVIRFERNFGKSAALAAGFAAARGRIIITLDGDMQDAPHEVPRFLAALDEGLDLVSGWKRRRRDPWGKRAASRLFNWVVARLTGLPLHDINCGFKAYRAQVARSLPLRRGLHRFIPLLVRANGGRVGEIVVAHRPRVHGRSKYGWQRLPQVMVDLHLLWLVARRPQRSPAIFVAVAAALLGLGTGAIAGAAGGQSANWALAALGAALDLAGAHFLVMGLLTRRALAREPEGASYSIAEQLD